MLNVTYRIEVKPVNQSLESLNSEVVYFLLCVVFWLLKSISFTRPISRAFLTFDLQQCKMIYSFVDTSLHLSSFESGLCKFIFRQMFKHGSLVNNGK